MTSGPETGGVASEQVAAVGKVLVRLPNWLGDIMMALPALQALRAALPSAEIVAMVRPDHAELADRIVGLDGIVTAAPQNGPERYRAGLTATRELRQRGFDVAVVLAPSFEAALTVWLAGIKLRIGHDTDHRGALLNRVVAIRDGHQAEGFLDVVAELGAQPDETIAQASVFACAPQEQAWAEQFLSDVGVSGGTKPIFVNPAAAKRPRAWAGDRFVQLTDALVARHPDVPVILHHHHPFELPDGWPGRDAIRILSGASLMELAAVVERCRLYVGNNSGPMHVAAALGVPTIGVFGSMSPELTAPRGPRGARHLSVSAHFDCSPCRERFFDECPSPPSADERPPCLNAITVESVVEAVDEALRSCD